MKNNEKKFRVFFALILGFLGIIFTSFFFYQTSENKKEILFEKLKKIGSILENTPFSKEEFIFGSFPILGEKIFFEKIKREIVNQKLDFLLVDLSKKKLYFFEKGEIKNIYPVLAFGKEGSFWETPTGFYQIETKQKNAFSPIANVYMPYSLQFQGNFYIHGWPYYPGGKPVSSVFSGGCIRLATKDAKEIFEKVKIGTPILITKEEFKKDNFTYSLKIPEITAQAYLAGDLKSHFLFLEKKSEKVFPIASITKLITALVTTEYINLWRGIKIQKEDLIFTSVPRLKEGQIWTGFDLLYPLLAESSNEAAKVLSRFLGKEKFLQLMEKKAKSIGMEKATFKDNWGEDPGNSATLKDLFYLAKYLFYNRRFVLDITRGKIYHHLISKDFRNLENFNCFSKEEGFIGGKTGKTREAGETSLLIFEIEKRREKRPIVILILQSENACEDARKILEWIKRNFE